ncbi:hypothetical protein EON65_24760, partial [archaeon]
MSLYLNETDFLDFQEDNLPPSLLRILANDHNSARSPPSDHPDLKDCKLFLQLVSVRGIPSSDSWSQYGCSISFHDQTKYVKLQQQLSSDNTYPYKYTVPKSDFTWETFDYFGQSKVTCSLQRKRWFSAKTIGSVSFSLNDLLQSQVSQLRDEARNSNNNCNPQKSLVHTKTTPSPSNKTSPWYCTASYSMIWPSAKVKSTGWNSSAKVLQSKGAYMWYNKG